MKAITQYDINTEINRIKRHVEKRCMNKSHSSLFMYLNKLNVQAQEFENALEKGKEPTVEFEAAACYMNSLRKLFPTSQVIQLVKWKDRKKPATAGKLSIDVNRIEVVEVREDARCSTITLRCYENISDDKWLLRVAKQKLEAAKRCKAKSDLAKLEKEAKSLGYKLVRE